MNLDIIYEDNDLIVCHKPAGIATETKRVGQQDMVSLLKNYRANKGEPPYIGMVHRLDQPVEGLLMFGKTPEAAAKLSGQVQSRAIGKHYYAVAVMSQKEDADETRETCRDVAGEPDEGTAGETCGCADGGESLRLTDFLLADKKTNLSSVVPEGTPQSKKAVLDCRVIGRQGENVCFDIHLHTGRHHQIRVQMAHHGWPLLGDSKYGVSGEPGTGLALCAYRLTFAHPSSGEEMDFSVRPKNPVFAGLLAL